MKDKAPNLPQVIFDEWQKHFWPFMKHVYKAQVHLVSNVVKSWATFIKEVGSYREEDK